MKANPVLTLDRSDRGRLQLAVRANRLWRGGLNYPSDPRGAGPRGGRRGGRSLRRAGLRRDRGCRRCRRVRQAVLHGDRAGAHTLDSAADKAYTAASFKTDTNALVERAKTAPIAPILAKLPNLLLFGGGVLIKFHDEVIGAIGAAGAPGGDLDENCARAGLEKIRGRLQHLQ